jgi:hypothetical protein
MTCQPCHTASNSSPPPEAGPEIDRGEAGASIEREYERRRRNREARVRSEHPHLGGFLLWLNSEPEHQRAFRIGSIGEKEVAASLARRTADGPTIVLQNRRMPRGRGDIDFLAIAPSGVYVIDAKAVKGRVRVATPLLGKAKLTVNGFNRTKLIDGMDRQVAAVRATLSADQPVDVPVQGVLCFTQADLPLLGTLNMRGHLLLYRKALCKRLDAGGPLSAATIEGLADQLAKALPRA